MQQLLSARTADLMRRQGRRTLPLTELARTLQGGGRGPSIDVLERALRADHRFRILDPGPALPDLAGWGTADRRSYAAAFQRAGIITTRLVVLVSPCPGPEPGVRIADLMEHTLAHLALEPGAGGAAAAEALRLRDALELL